MSMQEDLRMIIYSMCQRMKVLSPRADDTDMYKCDSQPSKIQAERCLRNPCLCFQKKNERLA